MGRNRKSFAWGAAVILGALGGCASTYQASEDGRYGAGYTEKRVGDGVYWLRFNGLTNEKVDNLLVHWSKRASELCGTDNYKGTPEKKEIEDVMMMYSMGVMYPETVLHPYVEGKVECIDKALASSAGPSKYYPADEFGSVRLHSVTAPGIESGEKIKKNLQHYIADELKRYQTGESQPVKYYMDVVITKFIADGWTNTWLLGGMSGGTYDMVSVIKIQDVDTGKTIDERRIETKVGAEGESEYRLKTHHARELVEYAVSVFRGQSAKATEGI